jgi:hypothetical protein
LKAAVVKMHDNIVSGIWSSENGNAFLWVNGINQEACVEILKCAINEMRCNILFVDRHSRKDEFDAISRSRERDPNLFKRWSFPVLWNRGTELSQHVEVIMHLIFLGVVKATIKRIEDWLRSKCRYEGFVRMIHGRLESVQSSGLSWCKVLPYTSGNFGGWVSESYLAFTCLLPWFYSAISLVKDGFRQPYVEPIGPPKTWTAKENSYWLSSHNLPSKGLAKALKDRVAFYMNQEGGPPEPIAHDAVTGTSADVMEVA